MDLFFLFMLFAMGSLFLLVVFIIIHDVATRGPAVASWEAQYTQYRDGSGKRVSRVGIYYANRDSYIPSTTEVRGEMDVAFLIIVNAPRWNYYTYYLDPESVEVVEYDTSS